MVTLHWILTVSRQYLSKHHRVVSLVRMGEELSNQLDLDQIIQSCELMLDNSYCIYSKFAVAAVLVTECGRQFTGCNVENASYGLCICAERTAAVKAVSEGFTKFKFCYVMTRSPKKVAPCGACRQFLAEFGTDITVVLLDKDRSSVTYKLSDLLPLAFTPADLKSGVMGPNSGL